MVDAEERGTPDESIEESFLKTVIRSDLKDALIELSEVALDQTLTEGLLRDIPIIGTMAKLWSVAGTVRDQLFVKKLYIFYAALDKIPSAVREKQIATLSSNSKERQRVGEHLLLLLERLNHMKKPELLAYAFQSLLEGKIDRQQFDRLAYAIESLVIGDIDVFTESYAEFGQNGPPQWKERFSGLYRCGLLTIEMVIAQGTLYSDGVIKQRLIEPRYHLTEVGKLFHELIIVKALKYES